MANNKHRRRSAPLLWAGGAVAAIALTLGVNGTLAGWASAVIDNDKNSVASASSVSLIETGTDSAGGAVTCDTAATTTNQYTCSDVNKYGGVSGGTAELGATTDNVTPLAPGDSRTETVVLENNGSATGNLTLLAGACSNAVNDPTGGDTTATYDLCTQILVSVSCSGDATFSNGPVSLATFANPALAVGSLAPTQSTSCTFTVALPATTPPGYSNQLASQTLKWTLTAS